MDFKNWSEFHAPSNVDVLIIYDQEIIKNERILKTILRQEECTMQVYIATYRIRLESISTYLTLINGCILLDGDLTLLPNIIRMGRDGYSVMPATTFISTVQEQDLVNALSLNECALLHELANGHSERTIARKMGTTSQTTRAHLRILYKKLNVSLSVDAVLFAKRHKEHLHTIRRNLIRNEGVLSNKRELV